MRLNRFLAMAGVASRRKCETIIGAGRVKVNGAVVMTPAVIIDGGRDVVEVDGQRVRVAAARRYMILYKPEGVLTTVSDPRGRPTIMDLVPELPERLYPAGRLDADTTGLVFLTNDGRLAHRVMHPRHALPKRYLALVQRYVADATLERLLARVDLDDGPARALEISRVVSDGRRSVVRIVLGEGRKRQIRRMLGAVGHPVERLHRHAIGPLELGDLEPGSLRDLTPFDVLRLRRALGLGDT